MAYMDVKAMYRSVIDEVTTKSRPEFVQEGVDEGILDELRVLWEEKLQASGVLAPEAERAKPEPADSRAQLGPQSYYSTVQSSGNLGQGIGRPAAYLPTTNLAWQQRPPAVSTGHTIQTGQANLKPQYATPQPHTAQPQSYHVPRGPTSYPAQNQAGALALPYQNGSQQAYAQFKNPSQVPSSNAAQSWPSNSVYNLNMAQARPQTYANPQTQTQAYNPSANVQGANFQQPGHTNPSLNQGSVQPQNNTVQTNIQNGSAQYTQSQAYQQDESSRKRKAEELEALQRAKQQMLTNQNPQHQPTNASASHPGQVRLPQQDGPSEASDKEDEEEEPEREELENFSDIASSNDEEENVPNMLISQFLKVQRTKNKWKCILKGGVLHLRGRDHVFGSANGEFQF